MERNKQEFFLKIIQSTFFKDIITNGGKPYFVGGCVRDYYLGIPPNDIDIVICKIPLLDLKNILKNHGKVDEVGISFGIIKFFCTELNETFDIALPRKDKKGVGFKHTSIQVEYNHEIEITDDLFRRDFSMNSIAIDHNLKKIDPYGGLTDIKLRTINPTDINAFTEDSLRMLRAVQFSVRFGFFLGYECFRQIKQHVALISEITPERILMEFQKVIDKKGNIWEFLNLIEELGIFKQIFKFKPNSIYTFTDLLQVQSMGELLHLTVRGEKPPIDNWGTFFESTLKIDIKTKKELMVFEKLNNSFINPVASEKMLIFECLKTAPWLFDSYFFSLPNADKTKFESGEYPKSYKDLKVNGDDLMVLGFEGKKIGEIQNNIIEHIFDDSLENNHEKILDFIKNTYAC